LLGSQPDITDVFKVRLTETERPGSEDSAKEVPVMHLYVPWVSAVDPNARQREKVGHYILGSGHMIWPIAERFRRLTNRTNCAD
jgi:hypothetical protein